MNKFFQYDREALAIEIKKHKNDGKTVVFTNGCFDILHTGHVRYLNVAKQHGDILVVGLNSDKSVRNIKGQQRPIISEQQRAEVLCALQCIDFVVIFEEPTPFELIKTLQPNILVKGSDWKEEDIIGADIVKASGGKIIRADIVPGISTTEIINRIKKLDLSFQNPKIGQPQEVAPKVINTLKAPQAIGPYSQAIIAGDFLFLSGQIAIDPLTGRIVDGDIEKQTHQALKNIQAVLEASGTSMSNVVKVNVYLTDMKAFSIINDVYSKYFTLTKPARAVVQVCALPKDAMIEIDAIAIVTK